MRRRRGSKVNRDDTRSPFNTFNGKKDKYIHEKKMFNVQTPKPSLLAMLMFLRSHLHSSLMALLIRQFSLTILASTFKYHRTPLQASDLRRKAHPLKPLTV